MATTDESRYSLFVRRHPVIYYIFGVLLIGMFCSLCAGLLIPIAFAVLITLALSSAVDWLVSKKLPPLIATALVLSLALSFIIFGIWLVTEQVSTLFADPNIYKDHLTKKVEELMSLLNSGMDSLGIRSGRASLQKLDHWWNTEGYQKIADVFLGLTLYLRVPLSEALIVVVLTVILLIDRKNLRDRFYALLGPKRLFEATCSIGESLAKIERYLLAQAVVNILGGFIAAIICFAFQIPQPFLWGSLIGLLRFIPLVGFWIGALFPSLLSLAISDSWEIGLGIFLSLGILEICLVNVVEPKFVGKSVGLSAAGVIFATIFWGWLWGAPGVLLSVPLTIALITLSSSLPQLQFLPILLSEEFRAEPGLQFLQRILAGDVSSLTASFKQLQSEAGTTTIITDLFLPAMTEVHRLSVPANSKVHVDIKLGYQTILDQLQTSILLEEKILIGSKIHVLTASRDKNAALGYCLSSVLSILGSQSTNTFTSSLVSEVLTHITAHQPFSTFVITIAVDDDILVAHRFLKIMLQSNRNDLRYLVFHDPRVDLRGHYLETLFSDERVEVAYNWNKFLDQCREHATASRISNNNHDDAALKLVS